MKKIKDLNLDISLLLELVKSKYISDEMRNEIEVEIKQREKEK